MTDHYQDNIKETVQMSVELDGVIWSLTEKENNNKPCLAKGYVIKKEAEGEQAIHWLKKKGLDCEKRY
ncbi:MAG: hypothetical protein GY714_03875 [Desulfobacterales bacterium]|nr:hypothetical protein [Desulfobacterales bacterium]